MVLDKSENKCVFLLIICYNLDMRDRVNKSIYLLMLTVFIANVTGLLLAVHNLDHCDDDCHTHHSQDCPVCQVLLHAVTKFVLSDLFFIPSPQFLIDTTDTVVLAPGIVFRTLCDIPRAPPLV